MTKDIGFKKHWCLKKTLTKTLRFFASLREGKCVSCCLVFVRGCL